MNICPTISQACPKCIYFYTQVRKIMLLGEGEGKGEVDFSKEITWRLLIS